MGLTFYMIEDNTVLQIFRQRLSPFMKNIQKSTTSEDIEDTRDSIFDEIINAARSYVDDDKLSPEWYQYIRVTSNQTLGKEHDKLIAANLE